MIKFVRFNPKCTTYKITFSFNNNARNFSREFFNTQLVVVFIIDICTKVGKRNDACYAGMKK